MIRLTFLLRRPSDMSLKTFQDYRRNRHGPMVASYSALLKIRKYVQVQTIEDPLNEEFRNSRGTAKPYDGVEEVWWDSREDVLAALRSSEGQEALRILIEDEKKFIDLKRSPLWFGYEVPQINPVPENIVATEKSPLVKLYYVLHHHIEQSLEEAQFYWRVSHGPKVRQVGQAIRTIRYIQVHRLDDKLNSAFAEARGIEEALYFGHAELWLDRAEMLTSFSAPEGIAALEALIEDERGFIDFSRSALWLTKEHIFINH